jgi:hypothetical protein
MSKQDTNINSRAAEGGDPYRYHGSPDGKTPGPPDQDADRVKLAKGASHSVSSVSGHAGIAPTEKGQFAFTQEKGLHKRTEGTRQDGSDPFGSVKPSADHENGNNSPSSDGMTVRK